MEAAKELADSLHDFQDVGHEIAKVMAPYIKKWGTENPTFRRSLTPEELTDFFERLRIIVIALLAFKEGPEE